MNNLRAKILLDIHDERSRQDSLHPGKLSLPERFVTICEELGEVAEALQDKDMEGIYRELIDTAASCVRMAEQVLKGDEDGTL
jgi:NTP pyrophosphatase (non-canonical NTP hydrolase)